MLTILNGRLSAHSSFVNFYSDDGSHLKHNKIPHKLTCGLVSDQGGRLVQVKITKKDKQRAASGRPLNTGGCIIQVTNTAFV